MNKILPICTCLAVLLASCTQFSARLSDMGKTYSGVDISSPGVVYRVADRYYVQGVQAEFEHHSPLLIENIKDSGGGYRRIPGTEGAVLYHEMEQGDSGHYYLAEHASWQTDLPGKAARIIFSPSTVLPVGACVEQSHTTARALYAYPLAAVAFVGVDVPGALLYTAWGILMIPYELTKTWVD